MQNEMRDFCTDLIRINCLSLVCTSFVLRQAACGCSYTDAIVLKRLKRLAVNLTLLLLDFTIKITIERFFSNFSMEVRIKK